MKLDLIARGVFVRLRPIECDDADYAFAMRSDKRYNKHLSVGSGSVSEQRAWIEAYKLREARGEEFYFVIEGDELAACGLVRIYDINSTGFTWGSWILGPNKPRLAALDSAVASFGFGFGSLGKEVASLQADVDNLHAISFYRRFNMEEVGESEGSLHFRYTADQFHEDAQRWHDVLVSGI